MFFQTQFEGHPSPSENRNIEPKSYAEMIQHPLFWEYDWDAKGKNWEIIMCYTYMLRWYCGLWDEQFSRSTLSYTLSLCCLWPPRRSYDHQDC